MPRWVYCIECDYLKVTCAVRGQPNCALTRYRDAKGRKIGRGEQCRLAARHVTEIDCTHCEFTVDLSQEPERCETPVMHCPNCKKWPTRSIPRGRRFDELREPKWKI